MGAWEAAPHGAAQYGHGRVQVVPGKAAEAPAGMVMLTVGSKMQVDPTRTGPEAVT